MAVNMAICKLNFMLDGKPLFLLGVCDTGAIETVRLRPFSPKRWLKSIWLRRDVVVCACVTDS